MRLIENENGMLQFDKEYDEAMVGMTQDGSIVYDESKLEQIMMQKHNMNLEEATHWVSMNVSHLLKQPTQKKQKPTLLRIWGD